MASTARVARRLAVGIVAILAAAGLSSCSSSSKDSLTFCTDPTYQPAEYYTVGQAGTHSLQRTLTGADIDIAKAIAGKIDRSARFRDTDFADILTDVRAKKCDAAISFINNTAERRKLVSFVDYLAAGQSVLTKKSAPAVTSVADLYGRTVAVAEKTTEADFLAAQNASAPAGKQIMIKSYSTEQKAIFAVAGGSDDVYFGDAPTIDTTVAADSNLRAGAQLVAPLPIGIALPPGSSLTPRVAKAVKTLYDNGAMGRILSQWKLSKFAITP